MNETALIVYKTASFFVIYAFFGWCLEVVYQAVEHGKFINRGFLNGPYCPIYGFGVIIVYGALEPLKENILILYFGAVMLTTALELITGFLLEKIFDQKWWDYSHERFNLKGYICIKFSLLWGVACLVTVRLIHPAVNKFVDKLPHIVGIPILVVFFIGFISDMIITILAIIHIKKKLKLLDSISDEMRKISDKTGEKIFDSVEYVIEKKNSLDERTSQRREKLSQLAAKYAKIRDEKNYTVLRLSKAFPKLNIYNPKHFKEQIRELKTNFIKKSKKED
ncbi:putative ABC transporter permease [Ruminococcus flavefaciens]|uniref:Uncharacterized membrane protein n=1 Tax=Ruminococcus flavefaciens TaxID=1265 RepID=A0A1M7HC61_RUMFL|nr:putative ABC transporter permease [Ruminococcus flavefaciens]SHM26006.1 Uncharacterized membrane protein [Ruminococcus flavefaciens]